MKPVVAVIGGTGIHYNEIFVNVEDMKIKNQYGEVNVKSVEYNDKRIIFLERHGKGHSLAPHEVNYKANISALSELGVGRIIATAAVGAINKEYKIGDFILIDDFIDFTKKRNSTFFENTNDGIMHIDMSEPYCQDMRNIIMEASSKKDISIKNGGTYVCTEGPRFETKAEIKAYSILGADVVGMTNVPEVVLAREKGICYAAIAMITNYAAGISESVLTHKEVIDNMNQISNKLKNLLLAIIDIIPEERNCRCRYSTVEKGSLK